MAVTDGKTRSVGFDIRVPRNVAPWCYVIGGEVVLNGQLIGEAAVALIDVI